MRKEDLQINHVKLDEKYIGPEVRRLGRKPRGVHMKTMGGRKKGNGGPELLRGENLPWKRLQPSM